jgi:ATP-dependent helicase HrpB
LTSLQYSPNLSPMLPVRKLADELVAALEAHGRAVLCAPTGSGKSTQVPQMLLGEVAGRIVVLQPRRLAARLLARRVAAEVGCEVGGLVGYQTRHERHVSGETRILFVTEGLFLRMMAGRDGLAGIGAVVIDEFHERHLDGDTVLALAMRAQEEGGAEFKLIVMSATLDAEGVAAHMGCEALRTEQRIWPVEISYRKSRPDDRSRIWEMAARAVKQTLAAEAEGDVLVFMPGVYEIERTLGACRDLLGRADVEMVPLYGELPAADQDRAVTPGPRRKVIVATNVAETSITIESVHHVVDSGLVRRVLYDPRRQFNMLALQRTSQSSADQRAGRAGRVAPGTCRRLWSLHEQRSRPVDELSEIKRLDLGSHVLLLKSMGIGELGDLPWFEAPSADALGAAELLLQNLGATDGRGITETGRQMAALPMHPRLARLVVEGARTGNRERAALWAALLSDRNLFVRDGASRFEARTDDESPDPFARLERALEAAKGARFGVGACQRLGISANAARQVLKTRDLFLRASRSLGRANVSAGIERCLLVAFPDQVGVRRSPESPVFDMAGGRSAHLGGNAPDPGILLVAAEIIEVGRKEGMVAQLGLHLPLAVEELAEVFGERVARQNKTIWDPDQRAVRWEEQVLFDELVVARQDVVPAEKGEAAAILAERIAAGELKLERWGEKEEEWIARVRCVAEWFPEKELLTYSNDDLLLVYQEICEGATRYSQVRKRLCLDVIKHVLSYSDQQLVAKNAPERIKLGRGYGMRITYRPGEVPRGRAKIQDFYGMTKTPTVASGRVKVLLEILAPNFRPVQTTDDLAGFWERTYPEIKRQLSRRYPRHEWR